MNNEILLETSINQNIEVDIRIVKDDTRQQIKNIEELLEKGVDLLVVSPNESTAITPVIQKAFNKGTPVILVDRKIDTEDYTAYIGADNYQIGKEAGLYIAGILNKKGNVVEMRGWNGSTSDAERHAGFMDGIKNYPDIKIIAECRGNFLKEDSEKEMTRVLNTFKEIDLVFAMNDPMALGVHEAISKYSGRFPFIIGIDALPGKGGGIENIEKGIQNASFIYPTGGDKIIDLALKILQGKPYLKENILHTAVVDKSNVRVLQLQTEQIANHQQKVERIKGLLDESLKQYSNQQTLFYGTILVLLLISILLVVSALAYHSKSKSNRLLKEQKKQLLSLSKQLEEATNAKLVFFTNISHEFRTPLTLILGPIDTLLNSGNISVKQRALLEIIQRSSNSLLNLLSQILEFRKLENGKLDVQFVKDDIKRFLEDLNIAFFDYAKRKELNFTFTADDYPYVIPFDKDKIEKIYFNLLSNAFKHTHKNGAIRINITRTQYNEAEYFKLSVYNDGEAIPPDKINNIFNRFYKVNPTDSGTGIGLALTNSLVDLHNGVIAVESIEGKGTLFNVLLPYEQKIAGDMPLQEDTHEIGLAESLLQTNAESMQEKIFVENILSEDKKIILLIDDNADMRNYMRLILQNDYTIIEADNGSTGIELSIKFLPDIIICDVIMPGIDGFQVCKSLKGNMFTSHIPVILLTACSLDEQKAQGFVSGADAYIPKPFNAQLLKIRIDRLIENRQKIKDAFASNLLSDSKKSTLAETEQSFINKFQEYVENNITDPDLNIVEVAQYMGLSRSQLYRKMKSITEYSPNEFVRILRLKYAARMITSGTQIAEIAYKSGFSSASYFTKCFKEFYKVSPTEFMKGNNSAQ
ncbi:hybrid sensor histidine kinase/response regulator transcription factor [Bacteroides pyogenes]|nr:substrate-binding domain-containing protein [Bacteroides pyogenes]MCF2707972.1 substrate-binding domain-containing protein [Bacteroides pyogenes]MCI7069960.1 substrate-binding domain-containing protein [Bacteroides pyogenes]MDY5432995.1 substrate-binding domain-containing protein [Bacteroides pyogenes]GAE18665.1 GDP-mannose 4,6 dehydratase [Bacteroides pyogenes DSM 20611 = JCM 6294]